MTSLLALILTVEPSLVCPQHPLPSLLFPSTLERFPSNGHLWLTAPLTGEFEIRLTSNGRDVALQQVVVTQLTRRVVELIPSALTEGEPLELHVNATPLAQGVVAGAAPETSWRGLKWFQPGWRRVGSDEGCLKEGPFLTFIPFDPLAPVLFRYRLSTTSAKKACEAAVTGFALVSTEGTATPEEEGMLGFNRITNPVLIIGEHLAHEEPGVRFTQRPGARLQLHFLCLEALGVTGQAAPPAVVQFGLKQVTQLFTCSSGRPPKENKVLVTGGTEPPKP